jgi:N-methylhydantoinase A/oxoprolinase/acetone carboxylase beta subunit
MVDVNAIGSGGGSIAWLDASGSLRVGPHSAGSEPGPVCYGRGASEPTVTDASVVLGYLNPDYFAGGALTLNPQLAHEAIHERIALPMGYSVEQAALGIHRVVNAQMAEGIRLMSINRGVDPREYALVALGGAGPLACMRARRRAVYDAGRDPEPARRAFCNRSACGTGRTRIVCRLHKRFR